MAPTIPRPLQHPPEMRSLISSAIGHIYERAPPLNLLPPTQTLKSRSLTSVLRRQQVTVTASSTANPIIPATYAGLNEGPSTGAVAGIVFGSVAGVLLILWLIYTCFTLGNVAPVSSVVDETEIRRHSHHSHSTRRAPSSHSEIIEVTRTRERSRSRSRTRSPPPVRSPPRRESSRRERETIVIEETRRTSRPPPQDDIVEVIEEHSPVRRESRRSSGRQGTYRTVDPDAIGGGDRPPRKMSRR